MEKSKLATLLLILSLLAITISIMANKNQFVVFNLAFIIFVTGIFFAFSK